MTTGWIRINKVDYLRNEFSFLASNDNNYYLDMEFYHYQRNTQTAPATLTVIDSTLMSVIKVCFERPEGSNFHDVEGYEMTTLDDIKVLLNNLNGVFWGFGVCNDAAWLKMEINDLSRYCRGGGLKGFFYEHFKVPIQSSHSSEEDALAICLLHKILYKRLGGKTDHSANIRDSLMEKLLSVTTFTIHDYKKYGKYIEKLKPNAPRRDKNYMDFKKFLDRNEFENITEVAHCTHHEDLSSPYPEHVKVEGEHVYINGEYRLVDMPGFGF